MKCPECKLLMKRQDYCGHYLWICICGAMKMEYEVGGVSMECKICGFKYKTIPKHSQVEIWNNIIVAYTCRYCLQNTPMKWLPKWRKEG